jgi:hypothetical protein
MEYAPARGIVVRGRRGANGYFIAVTIFGRCNYLANVTFESSYAVGNLFRQLLFFQLALAGTGTIEQILDYPVGRFRHTKAFQGYHCPP